MSFSEKDLQTAYRLMDLDPSGILQQKTYQKVIRSQESSSVKRLLWPALGAAFAAVVLMVWLVPHRLEEKRSAEIPVLPAPAWLEEQADFSMYESASGELLVPVFRRHL